MKPFYTCVTTKGSRLMHRGYDAHGKRVHESLSYRPTLFLPTQNPNAKSWSTIDGLKVESVDFENMYEAREFIKRYEEVENFPIFGNIEPQYQFISDQYGCEGDIEYDPSLIRVLYIDIEVESENGFASPKDANEKVNAITVIQGDNTYSMGLGKFSVEGVSCRNYTDESRMLKDFLDLWELLDCDIVTGWNVNMFDMPYLYRRIERVLGEKAAKRIAPWREIRDRRVVIMDRENMVYEFGGITILDYYDLYRKFTFVTRESYKLQYIATVELGEGKDDFSDVGTLTQLYQNDFQRFMEYNIQDTRLILKLEDKLHLIEQAQALAYSARCNFGDVFSQVRMWDGIIYNYLRAQRIAIPPKPHYEKSDQFEGAYVKEPLVGQHEWVASFDLDSLYPHLIMQYGISPENLVTMDMVERRITSLQEKFRSDPGDEKTRLDIDSLHELKRIVSEMTLDRILAGDFDNAPLLRLNLTMAGNRTFYRRDRKGFLSELMDIMYSQRKEYKRKMLEAKAWLKSDAAKKDPAAAEQRRKEVSKYGVFQLVRKVQLNSAFGALGNQYCRYYNPDMAEAITVSGQLSIRWAENNLNRLLNKACGTEGEDYVIASDTDSVYLRLGCLVDRTIGKKPLKETIDFLDKSCNEVILPRIAKWYEDLAKRMNAPANRMSMKREGIAAKGIWTAKKRYMLAVHLGEDNVYVEEPDLKIMGIEVVRSSTPQIVRTRLREAIRIIMTADEGGMRRFVEQFHDEFVTLPPQQIAFPRGCNNLDEYADAATIYKKATPIAVKGALIYNHHVKMTKGLSKKHPFIRDGEKIKFIYLKVPNPIREKVLSFVTAVPPEFGLDNYIDRELQFEKAFIEPLTTIVDAVGWKIVEQSSLEDLFT